MLEVGFNNKIYIREQTKKIEEMFNKKSAKLYIVAIVTPLEIFFSFMLAPELMPPLSNGVIREVAQATSLVSNNEAILLEVKICKDRDRNDCDFIFGDSNGTATITIIDAIQSPIAQHLKSFWGGNYDLLS